MSYESGDDPRLLADVRLVLKHWHKATLGDTALADNLACVKRSQQADAQLTRAAALRHTIRRALARLREKDQVTHANLLEQRYVHNLSVYRLQDTHHLSERSVYYRLHEALVALTHALWELEQREANAVADTSDLDKASLAWRRSHHLPPPTYTRLFGTEDTLTELVSWLADPGGHWIISLEGPGGIGKTALAREATYRLAETDRFDDIAWLTAKPELYASHTLEPSGLLMHTCGQLLDTMASQLAAVELAPLPLQAKRERVRHMLASRCCLVVLDNLEAIVDCGALPDWLWEMTNPSKFLLTNRHRLESGFRPTVLRLHELSPAESRALMRHEGHLRGLQEVAEAEDEVLESIVAVTGGNPLALKLVVGQLVSLPLSRVLNALQNAQLGMDVLYDQLYCASWDLLSVSAKHLLLRMSLLPGSCGTWEDLSSIAGLSEENLAAAIGELTAHSLVQAAGLEEKTYSLHALTRHFAMGQAAQQADKT